MTRRHSPRDSTKCGRNLHQRPRLIYASSEHNADALYATGFFVPDAFIFLEHAGKKHVVLSDLELGRGRREARVDEVISLSQLESDIRGKRSRRKLSTAGLIYGLLKQRRIRSANVPSEFPLLIAQALARKGVTLNAQKGLFWPERAMKTPDELRKMNAAVKLAAIGIERAFEVLKRSKPGPLRILRWAGKPLTSERLRAEIDTAVLHAGGRCDGTIVAGGRQACDPHDRGSGPLKANELIILDVFPRGPAGYYGDLTRTVLRGRATENQRSLWQTVYDAQRAAIRSVRPGVSGAELQRKTQETFAAAGYETGEKDGVMQGFFHGLGHGLGLDLHELPRLSAATFAPGNVFTIEPGLYYPEIGGVRIEDDVVVTTTGRKILGPALACPLEL